MHLYEFFLNRAVIGIYYKNGISVCYIVLSKVF